jgi:hypothetical protein
MERRATSKGMFVALAGMAVTIALLVGLALGRTATSATSDVGQQTGETATFIDSAQQEPDQVASIEPDTSSGSGQTVVRPAPVSGFIIGSTSGSNSGSDVDSHDDSDEQEDVPAVEAPPARNPSPDEDPNVNPPRNPSPDEDPNENQNPAPDNATPDDGSSNTISFPEDDRRP